MAREDIGRVGVRVKRVRWRLSLDCGHVVERVEGQEVTATEARWYRYAPTHNGRSYSRLPKTAHCEVCRPRGPELWAPLARGMVEGLLACRRSRAVALLDTSEASISCTFEVFWTNPSGEPRTASVRSVDSDSPKDIADRLFAAMASS